MAEGGKLTSPVGKVKNAGIPGFGPGCGILWSLYWECLGLPLFFAHFSWLFPWVFSWNSLKIQVFNLVGFFFFLRGFFFSQREGSFPGTWNSLHVRIPQNSQDWKRGYFSPKFSHRLQRFFLRFDSLQMFPVSLWMSGRILLLPGMHQEGQLLLGLENPFPEENILSQSGTAFSYRVSGDS